MKSKIYMIVGFLLAGLTSCNEWLDVKPETEETLEEMYSNQQGFQDVLTGSYLNLKSDKLYGKQLIYGNIEYLAQHWDWDEETVGAELSRYNYRSEMAENVFSGIYGGLYHVIAELNMMLQNMDGKEGLFEKGMFEVIKGEALAMRAFCHLDILRMFGPMPSKTDGRAILPYVKKAGLEYNAHIPFQEYVRCLENDLLEAERLLKTSDPIIDSIKPEGLSVSADDFLKDRQLYFNYYAVKAVQARFYLWVGGDANRAKALACAKEVIGARNGKGLPLFRLGSLQDITGEGYSFPSEHIMAVHDYRLSEKAKSDFTGNVVFKKDEKMVKTDLYDAGTTDIRLMLWIEEIADNSARSFTTRKFRQPEEKAYNQIPLIRLSEMYFIAMECGTLEEANAFYNEFCIQRDIVPVTVTDADQLSAILLDEYNREFYAEGQMFYTYKRMAVEDILWAMDVGNEESYVVPLPKKEVNYK